MTNTGSIGPSQTSKHHALAVSPDKSEGEENPETNVILGEVPNASESANAPPVGAAATVSVNAYVYALAAVLAFVMMAL